MTYLHNLARRTAISVRRMANCIIIEENPNRLPLVHFSFPFSGDRHQRPTVCFILKIFSITFIDLQKKYQLSSIQNI